jgi:uncharacterized FAD-dependent dehydrogenase
LVSEGKPVPKERYDVIIVGASPAGIFAALELTRKSDLNVLIIDKGKDISQRKHEGESLISGWGGAGAFSDGKLNFSTTSGGWLREYVGVERLKQLMDEVDRIYLEFGASNQVYGVDYDQIAPIMKKAALAGLKLVPFKIRHLGSDMAPLILQRMKKALEEKADIMLETEVTRILTSNDVVSGVELRSGEKIYAEYVIVAAGRAGASWLRQEATRLGIKLMANPVDIGVRVEVPAAVMEEITDVLYEPKFLYYSKSFDDRVRTFCVCPHGFVVPEYTDDLVTVNGHSYLNKKSDNTNFALLVSTKFTEPFNDPIAYGKYIAKLANLLVGGVMVQRLADLDEGRRSTPERLAKSIVEPTYKEAKPGDLSFVLPARYLIGIKEMLQALDKVAPGVYSKHTLLYGVEVKFYSSRLELSNCLETRIKNLFAIGDGAGITRGLVQASASGLIAAREILARKGIDAEKKSVGI